MKILFIHQNFPAQFRHLAPVLAGLGHQVVALAINQPSERLKGVSVVRYTVNFPAGAGRNGSIPELGELDAKVIRGKAAATTLQALKDQGFIPDIVFAHPGWGEALFVKDLFPKTRFLIYGEYYYGAEGGDTCFDPEFMHPSLSNSQRITLKNTHLLHALSACDRALSPTLFQKAQHPHWGQGKIDVIHDGIDTARFAPDPSAWIQLKSAGVTLRAGDEVVTFVARHLEPYRGFHIFMRALPLLQKLRPKARIIIVGGDGVSYGAAPPGGGSWKSVFLREVGEQLDMRRIHFVGNVPHNLLTQLLQVSAAHVYLTYPFVLSWSLLEAMSIGCLIVGSDTAPLREVITHGENGLLVDFFNPQALAETTADVLARAGELTPLRQAARARVVRDYDFHSVCLPAQIRFVLGEGQGDSPVA